MPEELETLITALFLLLCRCGVGWAWAACGHPLSFSYRYFCLAMLTYGAVWMR